MSKTWIVLGIIILLMAGFLWFRGSKQTQVPSNVMYDNVQTAETDSTAVTEPQTESTTLPVVSATSSDEQDLQVIDSQLNQLETDNANIDEIMK